MAVIVVPCTVLDPVSAPVTPNVPATVASSILVVPAEYISLNFNEAVPKSISLVVTGTIAPS